jgi:hypothetical protein
MRGREERSGVEPMDGFDPAAARRPLSTAPFM